MNTVASKAIGWTESGLIPDSVARSGMRRLMERKLAQIYSSDAEFSTRTKNDFAAMMRISPVALVPEIANEQHYEVPAAFFEQVLGENRKYSCCYWPADTASLGEAEAAALRLTVERAGIRNSMKILDLGCGWGSLSLWIAEHFPDASVTAVSNSQSQHDFIVAQAAERDIQNISVQVCDMNDFDAGDTFDRIVSIEMFEHMRNYEELFRRIDSWLAPKGKFFMHIFCHRSTPYEYIDNGPSDWMSRHFFSGGIMPSADLPLMFPKHLNIERTWAWNGKHYAKTCRAWLDNMDSRRDAVMPILADTYGVENADRWWSRWRMFFMACEELFRFNDGQEWYVSHYRFTKAGDQSAK